MNTATAAPSNDPNRPHGDHEIDHEMEHAARARLKMGWGQRAVVVLLLLTVVTVPPMAGFYSYFSGVPLHLLAANKDDEKGGRGLVRLAEHHTGAGPVPHGGAPRRGRRDAGNPQGRARLGRGRATAGHDAAAGASWLDGARSHATRPHPRSIRAGPRGRDCPGLGSRPARTDTRSSAS